MEQELRILKTHEISDKNWEEITSGFNTAFNQNKTPDYFRKYYLRTVFGYSYHALVFNERKNVIASNTLIPFRYIDKDDGEITIGQSGGTYVLEEYRNDIFIFQDMLNALWAYSSKEGVVASLGVPNENSFQYSLKFLDSVLIGYLPYYALPVRFFNLKAKKIAFLNFFSILCSHVWVDINFLLSLMVKSSEEDSKFQLKTSDEFYRNRFGGGNYREDSFKNTKFWYRLVNEQGICTIYLFDFRENGIRTFRALVSAILRILRLEKPDIILFIGNLRLSQTILLKVPQRLEPQRLPLTVNITDSKFNHYMETMSRQDNWNFGLMNFDAR